MTEIRTPRPVRHRTMTDKGREVGKDWAAAGNPAEQRLLSLMTTTDGLQAVRDSEISAELFEDLAHSHLFTWMVQRSAPATRLMLEAEYPLVANEIPRPQDIEEPVDWLIGVLRKRHIVNRFQNLIRTSAKSLGQEQTKTDGDPTKVLATLEEGLRDVREQLGRSAADDGMPKLWNAADLAPGAQPRWVAKDRLPRAAVSLLVGDEGIGKSLFWVYLAAAITTGKPLPDFGVPARDPGHVFVVVTEDDWSTTVRPRLEVSGADLAMVRVICTESDGSGAPEFPRDLPLIADADPAPDLIVVDAWLDTVPAKIDVKNPQQARQALHPWKDLATATDAAVLLLSHTNRVASAVARDKYGATGELRKKARMTLFAQRDDDGHLVIGPDKANTAAPVMASRFSVRGVQHFAQTEDHDGTVPLLSYVGETDQTAQQHIADAYEAGRGTKQPADEQAILWMRLYLAEGPRWVTDMLRDAKAAGHGKDRIKKAKAKDAAGIVTKKDGVTKAWYSFLVGHGEYGPPDGSPKVSEGQECESVSV